MRLAERGRAPLYFCVVLAALASRAAGQGTDAGSGAARDAATDPGDVSRDCAGCPAKMCA